MDLQKKAKNPYALLGKDQLKVVMKERVTTFERVVYGMHPTGIPVLLDWYEQEVFKVLNDPKPSHEKVAQVYSSLGTILHYGLNLINALKCLENDLNDLLKLKRMDLAYEVSPV